MQVFVSTTKEAFVAGDQKINIITFTDLNKFILDKISKVVPDTSDF
ncbi:MAG: hypothetical protein ACTSPG_01735 [Candidatus Hodarchaeales archaeon]